MSDIQEFNDIYPNDGTYFQPVQEIPEQVKEENEEKAKVQAGMKLLEDVIKKLDEEVKDLDSLQSIPKEARASDKKFVIEFNGNLKASERIAKVKDYFEGLMEQYKT